MKDPYAEIEYQCASMIDYLSALYDTEDPASLGHLHEQIQAAITALMELRYQKVEKRPDHLSARQAIIEFKDSSQNRIYRRLLPLDYEENDNGIILKGEDLNGNSSSIAFLSSTAVEKIMALTGKGWENPRCDHENQ